MTLIKNSDKLTACGDAALRGLALEIAEESVEFANPGNAVRRQVRLEGRRLVVGATSFELGVGRVFVIGAGKATFPIAKALEEVLGEFLYRGLVVCKHGQEGSLERIEMLQAAHPLPDANSVDGARKTVELLREVRAEDMVIACFTGGSSSLFVLPAGDIGLDDKARASELLLTCGANIVEINDVRKHLSIVKGGRLVRNLPRGTRLLNLTVSDVIGDALDYITDPSYPDESTFASAAAVLSKYELWGRMPHSVVAHLRRAAPEQETATAQQLAHLERTDVLLLSADAACRAAADAARARGFTPVLLSTLFEGDSGMLGKNFVAIAKQIMRDGHPVMPPCALIGGGETTVITNGARGRGGPNQEFAVAAALDLHEHPGIVVLGIDTDGTDGPTPYAGGLADAETLNVAAARGIDLHAALRMHDVSTALHAIDHHIVTGNTGTNVNDLKLALIAAQPTESSQSRS
ncbi:glycerate kinase type-2 family protein [Ottowia thiooxydans]|uniref:glycerate kinase type-2 family protein n=1 Tax=Ottowia thiooxydans TaxID=219182 RepID=UPI0003F52194|nr:DUF4147 domain-containing protein [Ottowia thiooxydans]